MNDDIIIKSLTSYLDTLYLDVENLEIESNEINNRIKELGE